jgi:hypothetical protein
LTSRIQKKVEKLKLLETRICDLPIRIDGLLEDSIKRVDRELKRKRISFRPDYYLGLGWGCVNKSVSIELPFWFGLPTLMEIEDENDYDGVENGDEILMGIRHEVGHSINYGYRLYREKGWKHLFGNFDKKYPRGEYFAHNPWSKRHVRHLPNHYAQKHPDEDWAETFAVWLTPRSNWRRVYGRTPAIEKLNYVDSRIEEIRHLDPLNVAKRRDQPVEKIERTVADFYGIDFEEVIKEDELAEYIEDLKVIFSYEKLDRKSFRDAWKFVHRYSPLVVDKVSAWISKADRSTIRDHLHQFESICRTFKLKIRPGDEEEKLIELTVLATYRILKA